MRPRGWFWLALAVTLVALGPLLSAGSAGAIAAQFGCTLNEGDVHPCVIAGHDWGGTLYAMGVLGWLMLLTIWLLPVVLGLWVMWLVALVRARRA